MTDVRNAIDHSPLQLSPLGLINHMEFSRFLLRRFFFLFIIIIIIRCVNYYDDDLFLVPGMVLD